MDIQYKTERRGNTYVVVMDYPERKKGTGTVFYTNPRKVFCDEWAADNSSQKEGEEK